MIAILFIFIAYVICATPFGFLIGKWIKGIDIREHGSLNIGATNVFRVVGKKWGVFVFFLDALKGYIGVCLPSWIGITYHVPILIALAVACLLGHTFTFWLQFKGGKGVATSFGIFLAICPVPTLLSFLIFSLVFGISHILSLGSLTAAICFPVVVYFTSHQIPDFIWLFTVSLVLPIFIFYTHRKNVQRLFQGQEKKLF